MAEGNKISPFFFQKKQDPTQAIASGIFQINTAVDTLGTPKDTRKATATVSSNDRNIEIGSLHIPLNEKTIPVNQIVRQGSGQFWGKRGLAFLQPKTYLLELNWHMTIILNGMVVLTCVVSVELLTVVFFLVQSLRIGYSQPSYGGGIHLLLKLIDSRNGLLQHNVAFALADTEDNVADLTRVGGVQKLQHVNISSNHLGGLCGKDIGKGRREDS